MIQIAGANAGQFGVLDVLGTANLSGHLDHPFGFTVAPILAGLDEFFQPSPRLASISALPMTGRRSSSWPANHRDVMRLNLSRLHFIDFARTFAVVLALPSSAQP